LVSCTLGTETNLTGTASLFNTGLIRGYGSETIEWTLTAPATNTAPHTLHWELDAGNTVVELNESNNTAQVSLFPPDLTIESYVSLPSIIASRYTLKARIENRGSGAAAACHAELSIDGLGQGQVAIPAIEAGGYYEWDSRIDSDLDFTNEFAEITLTVDSQNELVESSETNNASTFTFSGMPTDDKDMDGLPDVWEQYYHGTLDYGPTDDVDGDGYPESVEWAQQMNPTTADPLAPVRVASSLSGASGSSPGIQWQALDQVRYDIYCTTNLATGDGWQYRGTVRGNDEVEQFEPQTRSDADSPALFFRVEMQ
jgi:hypothetical protein